MLQAYSAVFRQQQIILDFGSESLQQKKIITGVGVIWMRMKGGRLQREIRMVWN